MSRPALLDAVRHLTHRDPDLRRVVREFGPPPLWARRPGFPTLLYMILEQQVSLASAKAAYDRLRQTVDPLTPEGFLDLDDPTLKTIGFSRQKTGYGRNLARLVLSGELNLRGIGRMDDETARSTLTAVKGIGPWTADVYLLMVLLRPDIWPIGDVALVTALQRVKGLSERPSAEEFEELGSVWKPWRAVAARILWHFYLCTRDQKRARRAGKRGTRA